MQHDRMITAAECILSRLGLRTPGLSSVLSLSLIPTNPSRARVLLYTKIQSSTYSQLVEPYAQHGDIRVSYDLPFKGFSLTDIQPTDLLSKGVRGFSAVLPAIAVSHRPELS